MSGYFSSLKESSLAPLGNPGRPRFIPAASFASELTPEPSNFSGVFGEEVQTHFVEPAAGTSFSEPVQESGASWETPGDGFQKSEPQEPKAPAALSIEKKNPGFQKKPPEASLPGFDFPEQHLGMGGAGQPHEDLRIEVSHPQGMVQKEFENSFLKEQKSAQDFSLQPAPGVEPENGAPPQENTPGQTSFFRSFEFSGWTSPPPFLQEHSKRRASKELERSGQSAPPSFDGFSDAGFGRQADREFYLSQNFSTDFQEKEKNETAPPQIIIQNGEEDPQIMVRHLQETPASSESSSPRKEERAFSFSIGAVELVIEGTPQFQSTPALRPPAPEPQAPQSNSRLRRRFITM